MLGTKVLRLPGPVGVVATILSTSLSKDAVTDAANLAGEKLRTVNAQALAKKQTLTAILTRFKMDLEQGERDGRSEERRVGEEGGGGGDGGVDGGPQRR